MAAAAFSRNLTVTTQNLGQQRRSVSPGVPTRTKVDSNIPRSKSAMVSSSNNFLTAVQQTYNGELRRASPASLNVGPAPQKRASLPGGLSPTHAMQPPFAPRFTTPVQVSQPGQRPTSTGLQVTPTNASLPRVKPFSLFCSDGKAAAQPHPVAPETANQDTGAAKPRALSPKDINVSRQTLKFPGVTVARLQLQTAEHPVHTRPALEAAQATRRPSDTPRPGGRGSISLARDAVPAAAESPEVIRVTKVARPDAVQVSSEKIGYHLQPAAFHTPINQALTPKKSIGGQPELTDRSRSPKPSPVRLQPSFGKPANVDLTQTSFGGLLIKADGQKLFLMCRRCEQATCMKENPGCLLDCQDVLCMGCCHQLFHTKAICCPFCRAQTPLTDREVADLVVPPGITELLEIKREDLSSSSLEMLMEEAGAVCPICLEPLALPKMPFLLHCGHNLCEECLLMVQCKAKGIDLECPQCLRCTPSTAPTVNIMLMYIVAQLRSLKAKLSS
eukprot:GGOE01005990.1.p1 GENE.GGOE01005990.1~~GGOE01005990.1.p1  ORF type:complete len:516 (-),score=104.42 GGOE01005990.1:324-1829(-)